MKKRWIAAACLAGLLLVALRAQGQEWPFLNPPTENPFQNLMIRRPPLNLATPITDPDYAAYLHFYGLDLPGVAHFGGYVPTGQEEVFVHVFRPPQPLATVVTMHGYFVHTGLLVHLITALVQAGYTVAAVDLPGHGLSTGARASIPDFGDYSHALEDVMTRLEGLPQPRYLIGHSTGGAGAWEYLLQHHGAGFAKAVLVAPLVRSAYWDASLLGFQLGQGWLTELPRYVGPTSTDPSFFAMVRRDPLQYPATPVQWVRALIDWNAHVIESYPPAQIPMLIVQGTDDTVVDYSWNLPFLTRKFPLARVEMLPGARHDLLWEAPAIRERAFADILAFLKP